MKSDDRTAHLNKFYSLIKSLESISSKKSFDSYKKGKSFPKQGVYFFFEQDEKRHNGTSRIVRVGTHAISENSKATLWGRLKKHKGRNNMEGRHRQSAFRKLVGAALINRDKLPYPHWGKPKSEVNKQIILEEQSLETQSSQIIWTMPFLSLSVPGESNNDNLRAYIETNAIALLSNRNKTHIIDKPSASWLGLHSEEMAVVESGLWNIKDTDKNYDPKFLKLMEDLINSMKNYEAAIRT